MIRALSLALLLASCSTTPARVEHQHAACVGDYAMDASGAKWYLDCVNAR